MRAVFIELDKDKLKTGEELLLSGDAAYHLIKVIRIRNEDSLLLLNGNGLKVFSKVITVNRKEVTVIIESFEIIEKKPGFSVALCRPKNDAFEDICRQAVELGVNRIVPIKSDYSQGHEIKEERLSRILLSALTQSNNPFLTEIDSERNFSDLPDLAKEFEKVIYFCSRDIASDSLDKISDLENLLIIIGPEAGLSESEEKMLKTLDNIFFIHLDSPILRSTTAISTSVGYLLALRK